MERIALTAQVRENAGKGVARGLRRNQMVPAVLYSHGTSTPISMVNNDVTKVLNSEGGEHALINLKLEGGKGAGEKLALIKDYQVDTLSGKLIHLDLMEVAMNEKVKLQVEVHITGNSIGVKEGGIFQYGQRQLEIECLPAHIPGFIEVNITHLKVNESLHVRDITAPEGVKILTEPDATVATIQPPISDAKLEEMLTATPAAAAEGGEPELVKKTKKEGEVEAAPGAEAKGKEGAKEGPKEGAKEGAKEAASKKEAAPKK